MKNVIKCSILTIVSIALACFLEGYSISQKDCINRLLDSSIALFAFNVLYQLLFNDKNDYNKIKDERFK